MGGTGLRDPPLSGKRGLREGELSSRQPSK